MPATPKKLGKAGDDIRVTVKPFGPTNEELDGIGRQVSRLARLRKFAGARARLLYVELVDDSGDQKEAKPKPPTRFRATFRDDDGHRTIYADGPVAQPTRVDLTESAVSPHPSDAEFAAALEVVRQDHEFAAALGERHYEPYQPIPAVSLTELPDGRVRRNIAVGLLPRVSGVLHEIVAVDLATRRVERFDGRAPTNTRPPNAGACGAPHDANQTTAAKGAAGQVSVTVSQGSQTLWTFVAVRPAASSGTNGSGIELRFVNFKGKRVLYRGHVPILNVKYNGNACGPYRDWQYQEGMIQATGTDVGPGFRLCSSPATTIVQSGSDSGTFLGTAIFLAGNEVVLISEMEAGWYRYVSEWRLHTNGTIRPRFAFAAVEHPCVCNVHHHHVYWRLDFDIRTAGNNRVREFNNPPLVGNSSWHNKSFETRRPRDYGRKRKWLVENTRTGEGYEIVPGAADGVASAMPDWPFGRGDVWILRYRSSELDDGVVAVGPPYEAQLDNWVNGEAISDHDVVVWYAGHFTHDLSHEEPAQHGHVLGPHLRPMKWG
jgi:hypothetical protein